ncbi:cell division topological specificity factor MinE [Thecamonas trahens ATCC 50062]|uniref:Cell division topological specificity factor MinE n=1 Tax=Thecamonas trahens ATCC 50062 TaxID=461836 RepID=A0A0L0DQJ6_THETB|nr:cell division topological specificity factor MinE [Thecamonas trahens ATCC 50062]KNC54311.1 cell division topological specificity factor MinE [Thecamonas trahens ATCC 50062]|eukprot:XP_013753772.1 cell division topological specificity factor MinE [Thecamonas trahens ATCC 50062]
MAFRSLVGRVFPSMLPASAASAHVARDRLQIILAKSRMDASSSLTEAVDMAKMQEDLLAVVRKHLKTSYDVATDDIVCNIRRDGSLEVFELQINMNA